MKMRNLKLSQYYISKRCRFTQ